MTTFLTDKIHLSNESATDLEPEDYLSSALGVIFPDDITNQHGDASTSVLYTSASGPPITLALADPTPGDVRLFSHFVWNAAVQLAVLMEEATDADPAWSVAGADVLELGAGTGLAGIVAAKMGAARVVISDYPADAILANLRRNVAANVPGRAEVVGHTWGVLDDGFARAGRGAFGRLLVADCLWMPEQHGALRASIAWFLREGGAAWVVAGFHTGREKMRGFWDEGALAGAGLVRERIWERSAEGEDREWDAERRDGITERKRWLVVGVLRKVGGGA